MKTKLLDSSVSSSILVIDISLLFMVISKMSKTYTYLWNFAQMDNYLKNFEKIEEWNKLMSVQSFDKYVKVSTISTKNKLFIETLSLRTLCSVLYFFVNIGDRQNR